MANVLVSSTLYYVWKREKPRKAKQINNLGFMILGLHFMLFCLFTTVLSDKEQKLTVP